MRTLIDRSIGPVWETNHVWLIYVLVMWWTGFPPAVRRGDVDARGAADAGAAWHRAARGQLRLPQVRRGLGQARLFGIGFVGSSLITPLFLGGVAGAIVSGGVPADGRGDLFASWMTPTSLLGGAIAHLPHRRRLPDRQDGVGRGVAPATLGVGAVTGALVLAALFPLRAGAPTLYDGVAGPPQHANQQCPQLHETEVAAIRGRAVSGREHQP